MELSFEVVRVLDAHSLVNAESYQCHYATAYGEGLEPGYYVVTWDAAEAVARYDATANYFGPCASRAEAEDFAERALHNEADDPSSIRH